MKKIVLLVICFLLGAYTASAQLDGLIRKAAKKAAERVVQSATDAASDAVRTETGQPQDAPETSAVAESEQLTLAQLMGQMPELPSAQQLIRYKELELKEQTMRLMMDPVTAFNAKVMTLSMQASSLTVQGMDSAQLNDMAYRYAELSTGLSREELDRLAGMTEEEQQAYLAAHYNAAGNGQALAQEAADVSQYLEPLQPMMNQWESFDEKIDEIYAKALAQCKTYYDKYAARLSSASGRDRNNLLLQYYKEIASIQRDAVQQALQIRLNQQLPVAEQIEQQMAVIRVQHQDAISALLNYPQLTAMRYFTEITHLLEIPESF